MRRPTQKQVREYLRYDPETGIFTWAKKSGCKPVVGNIAGSPRIHGYVSIGLLGTRFYAHQLAWLWMTGKWPKEIDHIDGDRANNRWDNLRKASRFQNNGNRKATLGRPLPKGVILHRNRGGSISYRGRIIINNKQLHLGCYKTPTEAHAAYVRAAQEYFREFARAK